MNKRINFYNKLINNKKVVSDYNIVDSIINNKHLPYKIMLLFLGMSLPFSGLQDVHAVPWLNKIPRVLNIIQNVVSGEYDEDEKRYDAVGEEWHDVRDGA